MLSERSVPCKFNLDIESSPPSLSNETTLEETISSPDKQQKDFPFTPLATKKIRKKRTAYHKIDDEIRIKLLEAVKNGETLKSVAKRYKVNYSSAKSVLHTYRKEGRILKKSCQESSFQSCLNALDPLKLNAQLLKQNQCLNANPNAMYASNLFKKLDFSPNNASVNSSLASGVKPGQGILDNLMNLSQLGNSPSQYELMLKYKELTSRISPELNHLMKSQELSPMSQNTYGMNMDCNSLKLGNLSRLLSDSSSLESGLKFLENPPLNTSHSTMSTMSSGERMTTDNSCSSRRNNSFPMELESFSDFANMFDSSSSPQNKERSNLCQPKFYGPNQLFPQQNNRVEIAQSQEKERKLENVVLDAYKTFFDAKLLLQNALHKATYFGNLSEFQNRSMN